MKSEIDNKIDDLLKASTDYYKLHYDNGGASEFDQSINDISRALIQVFYEKHGVCYMGKINDYDQRGANPQITFTPYTGQTVYNFEFCFIIPCEDEELRRLLKDWNTAKEWNGKKAWGDIEIITKRIDDLGGLMLSWS